MVLLVDLPPIGGVVVWLVSRSDDPGVLTIAASSAPSFAPPPPQAHSTKTTSVTSSPSLKACLTDLLWGYIYDTSCVTFS
jgi:hypothetical protein